MVTVLMLVSLGGMRSDVCLIERLHVSSKPNSTVQLTQLVNTKTIETKKPVRQSDQNAEGEFVIQFPNVFNVLRSLF